VRELPGDSVKALLDDACRDLEQAVAPNVRDWKAFIQVCGSESAWATMEAGKQTLRGFVP
jgi:hypothetical protein